jgi:hypothetical protein
MLVTSTGLDGAGASANLACACRGGRNVGLLQLHFWNVVKGWVLCGLGDSGKGLSGWLMQWLLVLVGGLG